MSKVKKSDNKVNNSKKQQVEPVQQPVAQPAVQPVEQPQPVQTPPVETKKQKRGGKQVPTPAVEQPVVQPVVQQVVQSVEQPQPAKRPQRKGAGKVEPKQRPVKSADKPVKKVEKKTVKKAEPAEKKSRKKQPVAPVEGEDEVDASGVRKRFFRCIYTDSNDKIICEGRYSGKKPKQAASKALTSILKLYQKNNKKVDSILFGIYECTRGSKNKKYFYEGKKSQLKTPIIVKITKKDKNGNLLGETLKDDVLEQYKKKSALTAEDVEFLTKRGYVVYKNNNVARKIPESQCPELAKFDIKLTSDS